MTAESGDWYRENSSEVEQTQFPDTECGLIDSLNVFDQSRQQLYDWLSSVATDGTKLDDHLEQTNVLLENTVISFAEHFKQIRKSADNVDDAKDQLTMMWLCDDNERVKLFKSLVDCESLDTFDAERMETIVNDLYDSVESQDDYEKNFYAVYKAHMIGDVETFLGHVSYQGSGHESGSDQLSKSEVIIELNKPEIVKHAIDIAKIALGVTIGIALNKRLNK